MAVQSKTLIGDVGSAVLAETVSQLNRAAGYVSSPLAQTLTPAGTYNWVLCRFSEDVYITSVEFGFSAAGGPFDRVGDIAFLVSGTDPDGSGGTVICSATDFGPAGANNFVTSDVWATLADMLAVCVTPAGSDAPFALDAGNALALRFTIVAPSGALGATIESVNVTYRPVKDSLTTSPNYIKSMQNFSSTAR